MNRVTRRVALGLCALAVALPAFAHEITFGNLVIDHPWSRATPTGGKTGAVYMTLRNNGDQPDRLIEVESDVAEMVELHSMSIDNGVMTMKPIEGVDIPAKGMAELKPHGLHVMLMGLKKPLVELDTFDLTLTFEHARSVKVEVEVQAIGAMEPMD